jgi:hypothetical protein
VIEGPRSDGAGPNVDPTGAPVEDAGLDGDVTQGTRPTSGRVLDRGAIYAAMVGLGLAVTIAISFALVVAIQALVFLSAPLAGLVIGFYANHKSERWRPRWRLFSNAGFAGLVTGFSLALMYVGIRLLFIYADSGFRPEPQGGQLDCAIGPDCYYARFVAAGEGERLASEGITGAVTLERAVWGSQAEWLLIITGLTTAGALAAATWRAVRRPPDEWERAALAEDAPAA